MSNLFLVLRTERRVRDEDVTPVLVCEGPIHHRYMYRMNCASQENLH